MSAYPRLFKSGEPVRLIPPLQKSTKERRVTSVFLAALQYIPKYSEAVLGSIGKKTGKRTKIECFTEVILAKDTKSQNRPDGLVIVKSQSTEWTALVEAKIGNAKLDEDQILRYIQIAKDQDISSVITISNELATIPTHHPIKIPKSKRRGVHLFHWSWSYLLTQACVLLEIEKEVDGDQRVILSEIKRFLEHESTGIQAFDQMNPEWKELVTNIKAGAPLRKNTEEIQNTLRSWYQEEKDLCLILSRQLGVSAHIKLQRKYLSDPNLRISHDANELVTNKILQTILEVPDTAAPIKVLVDLIRRTISTSMCLVAPRDKIRTTARVNWLLRQIADIKDDDVFIRAHWPGRSLPTQCGLRELRADPARLDNQNPKAAPIKLEILMVKSLTGKFSGRKTFIAALENLVPEFYKRFGENLRAWVPPPPKLHNQQQQLEGGDTE